MTTRIETYKTKAAELQSAMAWAEMLGKEYFGGGGGRGRIVKVAMSDLQLYYQYSDGAKNYHDADKALLSAVAAVVAKKAPEIINLALAQMTRDAEEAARLAHEEHQQLMQAAGLSTGAA